MAKKKIDANFVKKGMQRNVSPHLLEPTDYTFGLNLNTESQIGDTLNVMSEPSSLLTTRFPTGYKVIGYVSNISKDITYYWLTNPETGLSSIGYCSDKPATDSTNDLYSECVDCNQKKDLSIPLEQTEESPTTEYIELLNDYCNGDLKFDINYPIKTPQLKQEKLGDTLYWTNNLNPPRYLKVYDIEYYKYTGDIICGDDQREQICENAFDGVDVTKLLMSPHYKVPRIQADLIQTGGNLKMGTYSFLVAYCDAKGNKATQYFTPTTPISIFDENNNILNQPQLNQLTNFSIKLKVDNLDTNFKYYKVAVIEIANLANIPNYFIEGIHPTTDNTILYTSSATLGEIPNGDITNTKERTTLEDILAVHPSYEKVEFLERVNGSLYQGGLTSKRQPNLQPIVNILGGFLKWHTVAAKEDLYKDLIATSKYKGNTRDEVQPYGIRFFEKDGDYGHVFPLVARPAVGDEKDTVAEDDLNYLSLVENSPNCSIQGRDKIWQIYNTAEIEGVCGEVSGNSFYVNEQKSCIKQNVATISSDSYILPIVGTYTNLKEYIEENLEGILNGTIPASDETIVKLTLLNDALEATYDVHCDAFFESDPPICQDITLLNSENSVGQVIETSSTFVPKAEEDYILSIPPTLCNIFKLNGEGKIRENPDQETFLKCDKIAYLRKVPNNENCGYADFVINNNTPSSEGISYYNNYYFDADINNILTTKEAVSSSPYFESFLHKGAVWFKVDKKNRDSFIFEITKNSDCDIEDDIAVINNARYTFYSSCTATTPIEGYGGIYDTNVGVFDIYDSAYLETYPLPENFYVAIDNPIVTENVPTIPLECPTPFDTFVMYRTAPACGCFSVYTRDIENTSIEVTFDAIEIDKRETYTASCFKVIPKVDSCNPVPHEYGSFAYWESTETYPDNNELYNSQNLKINITDLFNLSSAQQLDFINYYTINTEFKSNTLFEAGTIYYIITNEGDDFTNIAGFQEAKLFLNAADTEADNWSNGSRVIKIVTLENTILLLKNLNLTCEPIRHFKFPDNNKVPFMGEYETIDFSESIIFPLGVTFKDNTIINTLLDVAVNNNLLTQEQRNNIIGYEILRGDNSANKSIIASGLGYDMYKYNERDKEVLYPNFPHNDLGYDLLHTENGSLITHPYDGEYNSKFSMISPEFAYGKPILPSEVKMTGYQVGQSRGEFADMEDHSKWVILSNRGRDWASALALAEGTLELAIKIGELNKGHWATFGMSNGGSIAGMIATGIAVGVMFTNQALKVGQYRYQWMETFKNLGSPQNFASIYASEGFHNKFLRNVDNSNYTRGLAIKKYMKDGKFKYTNENSKEYISVNNFRREYSVFLSLGDQDTIGDLNWRKNVFSYSEEYYFNDNNSLSNGLGGSKVIASQAGCPTNLSGEIITPVGSPYFTLKNYIPSQYGEIDSITWLTTNFYSDLNNFNNCSIDNIVFGGTCVISRYTYHRKHQIFKTDAFGLPDRLPFNYYDYPNVATPAYWVNYDFNDQSGSFLDIAFPEIRSDWSFDCSTKRGAYMKKPSKIYTQYHGIASFLVESEINCNFRYGRTALKDRFYPQVGDLLDYCQEKNLSISEPNTFFYNNVYSFPVTFSPYTTLDRTYIKKVYDKKKDSPNGVIYSEPDNSENDLIDPWLIYKPLNKYDFGTKNGKLIGLKSLESEIVLARFEDDMIGFNKIDNLAGKLTPQLIETGGSGVFLKRPFEFKATDLGLAGTQNTDMINTPYGHFTVDAKRGKVWRLDDSGNNLEAISESIGGKDSGMKNWFREQLPFKILKYFPEADIDNKFKGIGISMGWDARFDRVFITKKDYIPKSNECTLKYEEGIGFYTDCVEEVISCSDGYTYNEDTQLCEKTIQTQAICTEKIPFNFTNLALDTCGGSFVNFSGGSQSFAKCSYLLPIVLECGGSISAGVIKYIVQDIQIGLGVYALSDSANVDTSFNGNFVADNNISPELYPGLSPNSQVVITVVNGIITTITNFNDLPNCI